MGVEFGLWGADGGEVGDGTLLFLRSGFRCAFRILRMCGIGLLGGSGVFAGFYGFLDRNAKWVFINAVVVIVISCSAQLTDKVPEWLERW